MRLPFYVMSWWLELSEKQKMGISAALDDVSADRDDSLRSIHGYVILEMLGKGAYGAVYKARCVSGVGRETNVGSLRGVFWGGEANVGSLTALVLLRAEFGQDETVLPASLPLIYLDWQIPRRHPRCPQGDTSDRC